jgi:hypothetical protein
MKSKYFKDVSKCLINKEEGELMYNQVTESSFCFSELMICINCIKISREKISRELIYKALCKVQIVRSKFQVIEQDEACESMQIVCA